ncbi:MAG: RagB/SusD family nutrient uptake outer membrane protein [Filimonas sp.]|nr:RagB/SusD family nutrient uptake outer membrane protein [Filimonas sp.]
MKKFIIHSTYLVLLSTLLFSCKKYLDNNTEGKIPPSQFFKTADDAKQSVVAIYAKMRKWEMLAFAYVILQDITSDQSIKGGTQGDASFINDYDRFAFTSTEGQINDYWIGRYQLINLCNQAISNIPGITMDEALKARLVAEAKFARATFYFDLVRAYGDVPMPTSVDNAASAALIRTPKDQVYAQIVKDLQDAVQVLPDAYTGAEIGRATKGAARGYLAKVFMYQKQWDKVLEQTSAIISSGRYSLEPDFYQLFRIPHENGVESIFEVQCFAVAGNADLSNSQYSQVQGVAGTNGFGWGFNAPSDSLARAFDAAGDTIRKRVTILYRGQVTQDGDLIEGTTAMEGVTVPRYNGKSYVPRSRQVPGVNEGAEQNVRKMRYAEILLIDAEAKINKGDVPGAAASLKLVRDRVKLPYIAAPTLQQIWNERCLELAMEEDRFFDLVRTDQATTVLGPLGYKANKNNVFPVPQTVIDVTNGVIKQNPGY